MAVFLDTNVLAYQFDSSEPVKQQRAREVFLASAATAFISTQVLIELHAVLTRKLGMPRTDVLTVLESLRLNVVPADTALVLRAARTASEHDLSIFDAMVLEAAVEAGCSELFTEDLAEGSVLRDVRVVNPFREPE